MVAGCDEEVGAIGTPRFKRDPISLLSPLIFVRFFLFGPITFTAGTSALRCPVFTGGACAGACFRGCFILTLASYRSASP